METQITRVDENTISVSTTTTSSVQYSVEEINQNIANITADLAKWQAMLEV